MIEVLIVEDSNTSAKLITYILESDPQIRVQGIAWSGEEALQMIARKKPDIITMDIHLPGMDGFATTQKIMQTSPVPIIIITGSYKKNEVSNSFKALEAGALQVMEKPVSLTHPLFESQKEELLSQIKMLSEIKLITRRSNNSAREIKKVVQIQTNAKHEISLIVIGASTGGPIALQKILSMLVGHNLPPILMVQHITIGFTQGFADWLTSSSGYKVKISEQGEHAEYNTAYLAPDDTHLSISRDGNIVHDHSPPLNGVRPAVSCLFRAAAENYETRAIGIILTGMGADGAQELKQMRDQGAITMAQDQESSVVFGMPQEAIKLKGATYVCSTEAIALKILELTNNSDY